MFRDLLLPITGTPTDAATVESGVRLARALGAHLSVLETVSLPMSMPAPWGGGIPEALLQDLHAALLERGAANVAKLRGRLAGEGIAHEVRLAEALFAEPPTKLTIRLLSVRPASSLTSFFDRPSTSTRCTLPTMACETSCASASMRCCRRCRRSSFTSAGVSSASSAAGVPGRGL